MNNIVYIHFNKDRSTVQMYFHDVALFPVLTESIFHESGLVDIAKVKTLFAEQGGVTLPDDVRMDTGDQDFDGDAMRFARPIKGEKLPNPHRNAWYRVFQKRRV